MKKKLILQKATRIEGNADIHLEYENGRLRSARFQVIEFRGFEKFLSGRRVEWVPQLVSRICGLCSLAHQVAGLRALENAMGMHVDAQVENLRDVLVLGEWISSHALSYFFLNLPDLMSASDGEGIFALRTRHPEIYENAFALRQDAVRLLNLFGKRQTHPVTLGLGRFLHPPVPSTLSEAREVAAGLKDKLHRMITGKAWQWQPEKLIDFPRDFSLHFVAFHNERFYVFDRQGREVSRFPTDEFEENIAEMRVEWSLSKIPYLRSLGFPDGIMLVGPLARSFLEDGFLADPDVRKFAISRFLEDRSAATVECYDICRLLEMYWAAKKIEGLLEHIDGIAADAAPDWSVAGAGIGALEAPRGLLIHKYLVNNGYLEKARLLVATQFNNALINLLITDLAQKHSRNGQLTETGSRLIGRCIRLFDPCLSCATH